MIVITNQSVTEKLFIMIAAKPLKSLKRGPFSSSASFPLTLTSSHQGESGRPFIPPRKAGGGILANFDKKKVGFAWTYIRFELEGNE